MKQIIPFKKELPFKTRVSEITSISLERDINILDEGVVSGVFHITGDYKMNASSVNREEFSFDLPFDITLDPRYDLDSVSADIEDFYYDLVNEDTLKVNIDLYVEAEYLKEEVGNTTDDTSGDVDNTRCDAVDIEEDKELDFTPSVNFEKIEKETLSTEKDAEDREELSAEDIFSNLDDTETYTTYYVYVVKEEDTVEKILNKYNISREELESYNNISDIKPGDKVIIPKIRE